MLIDAEQIRLNVVRPALKTVGLWSEASENLIVGTGECESNYEFLKQVNGIALGYWQIEPQTHVLVKKWLNGRLNKPLADRVLAACYMSVFPDHDALVWNLRYSCLVARVLYYSCKDALPPYNDYAALAAYHKKYYNRGGKADVTKNTEAFRRVCQG